MIGFLIVAKNFSISFAIGIKSYWIRPQVGQETSVGASVNKPKFDNNSLATLISSTGLSLKDTRIVLPIF